MIKLSRSHSDSTLVMKQMIRILIGGIVLSIAPAIFACDYPARVDVPNGGTATKEDMLQGQRDVKQYVADMEAYLDCIVAEEREARSEMEGLQPEDEQQREDMLNKKYNAAVDDMEKVAARFNIEVQAYRGRDQ